MSSKIAAYPFIPKKNEQIDTVITVDNEPRSMIFGVVKDCKGDLIKDAVVKLFKESDCFDKCQLIPIAHAFTDECGQFFFGPLIPCVKYVIKVWYNDVKVYNCYKDSLEEVNEPDKSENPEPEKCCD